MADVPEAWEMYAYEKAKKLDELYSPQMRSWSPFFKSRAMWRRYVKHWRVAKANREIEKPTD